LQSLHLGGVQPLGAIQFEIGRPDLAQLAVGQRGPSVTGNGTQMKKRHGYALWTLRPQQRPRVGTECLYCSVNSGKKALPRHIGLIGEPTYGTQLLAPLARRSSREVRATAFCQWL